MAPHRSYSPDQAGTSPQGSHFAGGRTVTRRRFAVVGAVAVAVSAVGSLVCAAPGMASGLVDSTVGSLQDQAGELVSQAEGLMDALADMDFAAAQEKAYAVRELASQLQDELGSGIWSLAEIIPVYGNDVSSARELVGIVVDLCDDALLPLCDALAATPPATLVTTTGDTVSVDLASLQALLDVADAALTSLEDGIARLDELGDFHIDELSSAVGQVRDVLAPYQDKFDVLHKMFAALPRLLGSESPRTYLVVAQANCEIRSTGGFPGSMAVVTAQGGAVSIGGFSSMYDFMPRDSGLNVEVTDEEVALFGQDISWYAGIMNFIPHFPRVCDMWSQEYSYNMGGAALGGIVAVDPVLLQNMLGVYGSVSTSDGTVIDGTNAARVFMNDTYLRFVDDNDSQDAFFSEAAQAVFEFIMGNLMDGDMAGLLGVLDDAMDTRRLMAWMADADEQELMCALGCEGEVGQDPQRPQTGIYLGNETWGKIDWWLDVELEVQTEESEEPISLTGLTKKTSGQVGGTVRTSVRLSNLLTDEEVAANAGNAYVFGSSPLRRQDGDMVLKVWLYAPAGGSFANLEVGEGTLSGFVPSFADASHMGLQVLFGIVQLLPGEEVTLGYDVVCSGEAIDELLFDVTPICHD